MLDRLDCWFGDKDVDLALDGVECNWVVSGIGGEDGDGITWGEGIDGFLVGFCVSLIVCWVGIEGCVEVVVDVCDVLGEMLACESPESVQRTRQSFHTPNSNDFALIM